MKRIALFLTSILLIISFQSKASVSLNSFAVQSQFKSGDKIYSPNGVTFTADFSFLRTNADGNPIDVKLVYKDGSTETVISSSSVSKTSWGSELSWASSISGTLSQNQTAGYVCLKYTVYNLSGGVISNELSGMTYNITTTNQGSGANPGNAPSYISPVSGAIPLYIYSQTSGGHFYDTEWRGVSSDYSVNEKRNYVGILGFVFRQQLPGTVMLYRKASYDRYGVTGDWFLTTSTANVPGYAYTQDMGYVYESPTTHTLPVYQFNKPADHFYIAGQNNLDGYTLDGFAFNIITEDFTIPYKIYEYWSPSLTDHLYTASSVDTRASYATNSVPFKAFKRQMAETVPIYSFWNVNDNDHLYSKNNVSTIGGGLWTKEGIAFYAYEAPGDGRIPIYEYWSSESTDHYYTAENSRLISGQWVNGGIAFYALSSDIPPPPAAIINGGMPNDLKQYAKENGLMPTIGKTLIYANDTAPILTVGSSIYSPNQQYRLTLQTDGNVVIYKKQALQLSREYGLRVLKVLSLSPSLYFFRRMEIWCFI